MVRRRTVLAGIGSSLAVGIAGCTGGSDEDPEVEADEDAPARLELIGFDAPETVTYGTEFEAEITVANTGGEPIEEDASISLEVLSAQGVEPQDADVNAEGLGPGETRSHVVGPFSVDGAGELSLETGEEFTAVHDDVETDLAAEPATFDLDEQIETVGDRRVTVTDVTYEQALFNPEFRDGVDHSKVGLLRETVQDRIIAVPRVRVENVGSEASTIPEGMFEIEDGSQVSGFDAALVDGPDVRRETVDPGEAVDGYVAAAIDTDAVGETTLGLNFTGDNTPAEAQIDLGDDPGVPSFELAEADVPSLGREGKQEFNFTIENTGDGDGTFRGVLQFMYVDDAPTLEPHRAGEWWDIDQQKHAAIPAGETRTLSWLQDVDGYHVRYRLQPLGHEFDIRQE